MTDSLAGTAFDCRNLWRIFGGITEASVEKFGNQIDSDVSNAIGPGGVNPNTIFGSGDHGFAVDDLRVLATDDFRIANLSATNLFELTKICINDISAQNTLISDGLDSSDDIDGHVSQWISDNQAGHVSWFTAAQQTSLNPMGEVGHAAPPF